MKHTATVIPAAPFIHPYPHQKPTSPRPLLTRCIVRGLAAAATERGPACHHALRLHWGGHQRQRRGGCTGLMVRVVVAFVHIGPPCVVHGRRGLSGQGIEVHGLGARVAVTRYVCGHIHRTQEEWGDSSSERYGCTARESEFIRAPPYEDNRYRESESESESVREKLMETKTSSGGIAVARLKQEGRSGIDADKDNPGHTSRGKRESCGDSRAKQNNTTRHRRRERGGR